MEVKQYITDILEDTGIGGTTMKKTKRKGEYRLNEEVETNRGRRRQVKQKKTTTNKPAKRPFKAKNTKKTTQIKIKTNPKEGTKNKKTKKEENCQRKMKKKKKGTTKTIMI